MKATILDAGRNAHGVGDPCPCGRRGVRFAAGPAGFLSVAIGRSTGKKHAKGSRGIHRSRK
jgi:hypothetical protein